jgi:hypothetical protein
MTEDLKSIVDKNLKQKMSSTLKKIYAKWDDVVVTVRVSVSKVSKWYDWDFKFEYDGNSLDYSRKGFEILSDLVNHAFDNFKSRALSK